MRTRRWPAGHARVSFRFPGDIAGLATWCRLEDPRRGHVAFVRFDDELRPVLWTANKWAEVFSTAPGRACVYETQSVCERVVCERVGNRPIPHCTRPSAELRMSFGRARVTAITIRDDRAVVRFSSRRTIELVENDTVLDVAPWWVSKIGGDAGGGVEWRS